MFIVIFEVRPKPERFEEYLALAKELKPKLEATAGFIDNERFRSTREEGRLLSLSTWRDEKSVVRWRTQGAHHGAQEKGRFEIFADYHLRVGEITADTAPPEGMPVTQSRFDATEIGEAKAATVTELTPAAGRTIDLDRFAPARQGLVALERFESIYTPGKMAVLASWKDPEAAAAWSPSKPPSAAAFRHRQVRIIRDYGMFERREAPQFYPDVKA